MAELKQIVERPDLVEMHDVTAMDPKLLVLYRGCKYAAHFSTISHFLERILMEHIDLKKSLDSKLQIYSICFTRIRSRSWDVVEKPRQHVSNLYVR